MHPEHPDPEAEILWVRQPGIKGIELHGQRPPNEFGGHQEDAQNFGFPLVARFQFSNSGAGIEVVLGCNHY